MAWTDIARAEPNRDRLRFPSDLTDRKWGVIAPLIPSPKRGGRPRMMDMRDVMEAILFIASSGCPWRMLPGEFPPVSTVRGYVYAWRDSGLLTCWRRSASTTLADFYRRASFGIPTRVVA